MSDGTEDLAAQELVVRAYPKLKQIKPDHELLKYIVIEDGEAFLVADSVSEFEERFGKPDTPPERRRGYHWIAYTLAKYYLALEAACQDPDKPIVVSHTGSATAQVGVLTDVLGDDDDLPF